MIGINTPNLQRLIKHGKQTTLATIEPAVTCSVQSSLLTGCLPKDHGIVANGWYFSDLNEVWFWRQSNRLVQGEKVWEAAKNRNPNFTCANLFWWYNMASNVDISVTPRPIYKADGRKLPDIHSFPGQLRDDLQHALGQFPLFNFWGPMADIRSSTWIADAALYVQKHYQPTLALVYLPHLDYALQRLGPQHKDIAKEIHKIDAVCGRIINAAEQEGRQIVVLSEYVVHEVNTPIHINRLLRKESLLTVRYEDGGEIVDYAASRAFAVCDHQIAHIYIQNPSDIPLVRKILSTIDGIDQILGDEDKQIVGLNHIRAGELIALSKPDAWFTYYYWLNDENAPDFARTVDIHKKPGYDPVELFLDPYLYSPKLSVAWRLLKKKLGFRTLMDVIPLDANLIKGSHGRVLKEGPQPVLISSEANLLPDKPVHVTEIKNLILTHLFTHQGVEN
jgi:predicted AlkP superfamily pyrophosphatase or phosphodiesterase